MAPCRGRPRGLGQCQKSTFSEYGHVAYQIKGNKAYNNMLAKSLPVHKSLISGVGSKGHF